MGLFISELRKSNQMTQKELAEKLNVTDKAVSKWERGLSYPDISLLPPLSEILGITPGELLKGEKSESIEVNAETIIAIDNALQYANNAAKINARSTKRRAIILSLAIMVPLWLILIMPLLIWPNIARRINAASQHGIIRTLQTEISALGQNEIDEHFRRADEHNAALSELNNSIGISELLYRGQISELWEDPWQDYYSILSIGGIMGWIEIPSANIKMPIFHGSSYMTLGRGAGHMEGTAFPIGGYGNHSVITAHSGAHHARMFRDLEQYVRYGDYFYITVLDRRLTYRVDSIKSILPNEIEYLNVIPNADIVTLMTSTPYRINTHRLLVRGTRVL